MAGRRPIAASGPTPWLAAAATTVAIGGSAAAERAVHYPVYFREIARPYRSAAIVGQPYATDLETAQRLAAELGLVVHAPTFLTASWWAPGRTRLFCVTRPDVTQVQFLDDQTYWEW